MAVSKKRPTGRRPVGRLADAVPSSGGVVYVPTRRPVSTSSCPRMDSMYIARASHALAHHHGARRLLVVPPASSELRKNKQTNKRRGVDQCGGAFQGSGPAALLAAAALVVSFAARPRGGRAYRLPPSPPPTPAHCVLATSPDRQTAPVRPSIPFPLSLSWRRTRRFIPQPRRTQVFCAATNAHCHSCLGTANCFFFPLFLPTPSAPAPT